MPAQLLWSTGGTGSRRTSVSFATPSAVSAPGYICFAIMSASGSFDVTSVSSSLPYQIIGLDTAAIVIWKVESGYFSGTLTVNFSVRLNNYAFTAWAVTGTKLVYYDFQLPKRCVLAGGNLFFVWVGYTGSPNQLNCPDFTVIRADSGGGSSSAQSYLYGLTEDRYDTFSAGDWANSNSTYTCYNPSGSSKRLHFWFIGLDVYAPDPRLPSTEVDCTDVVTSVGPIDYSAFYDMINTTFSAVRPRALMGPGATPPHDIAYAVYARGASVRLNSRPSQVLGSPVPLGDTWPMLSLLPGVAQVFSIANAALLLTPGLGSVASSPTVVLDAATPSAYLEAPTHEYEVDPVGFSMQSEFGYVPPSIQMGMVDAPHLSAQATKLDFAVPVAGVFPRMVPMLAIDSGIFSLVPMYRVFGGWPGVVPSERGGISLLEGPIAVLATSPAALYQLGVGRVGVFLRSSGGGLPSRPIAPCVIRLSWGGTEICLRDYKVFEVQVAEWGHAIRLGLELTRNKKADSYRPLLSLKPGQLVDLDAIVAGGFKGSYRVKDISSVSLARTITFDILLQEESGHV